MGIPLPRTLKEWIKRRRFFHAYLRFRSIPLGLRLLNYLVHRVLRVTRGARLSIHYTSQVASPHKLKFSASAAQSMALSGNCYLQGINGIEIGEETLFAPGVKIISSNHDIHNLSRHQVDTPIRIGKRCWIGANVVILPGVTLGDDVVVAAGAVVTKTFDSGVLLTGVPATVKMHLNASSVEPVVES